MTGERADYSCPKCESSDVFRNGGKVYECHECGAKVHEAVLGEVDTLEELAKRGDRVGAIADRLLETGGVSAE